MKKIRGYILTGLILLTVIACKKPFAPNLTSVATNFLAVDGAIISGDSTFINLSRTTGLKDTTQHKVELKAQLNVEDDQGKLYPFIEKGKGIYALGITNFSTARKYRLNIKTNDGKLYQSDFVPMKVSPPIDSVYFKQTSDAQVLFYVNSHDPTNNTRYYRWDYKETYKYTSYFGGARDSLAYLRHVYSNYSFVSVPKLYVGTCYGFDNSNQIIIGSSAKLANDVISAQQVGGLASNSRKIATIYNMQLRQYALTEAGYNYYQDLRNNTETLGSIFDAQPSITTGNIHCISAQSERVIGFVSVSGVTISFLNLHYNDLPLRVNGFEIPGDWILPYPINDIPYYIGPPEPGDCAMQNFPDETTGYGGTILIAPSTTFVGRLASLFAGSKYPIMITDNAYGTDSHGVLTIIGYNYYRSSCMDCRLMQPAATIVRPAYFPPY